MFVAAIFTTVSLMIPYWSKIELATVEAVNGDDSPTRTTIELTFGVWGSCLTIMDTGNYSSTMSPVSSTGNTSSEILEGDELIAASFACASFFSTNVYSVSCRRSKCMRHDAVADASLCDHTSQPIELLLLVPEHEQHQREQLMRLLEDNSSQALENWESFRSDACSSSGALARANAGLAVASISFQGVAFGVLLIAITFAPVESSWIELGRALAIFAIALQVTLLVLWIVESRLMAERCIDFAMSFYLSLVNVTFLLFASCATRKHLRLVHSARRKIEEEFELIGADEVFRMEKSNTSDSLEVRIEGKMREVAEKSTRPASPMRRKSKGRRSTYVAV